MPTCDVKVVVDAKSDLYRNALAGTWKIWTVAIGNDGDHVLHEAFGTARVQRAAQLWADASPEPVKLQFRMKGAAAFTTLKTVKTDSRGWLRTTVTATADGDHRYNFWGNSSTPAVASHLDYVDVR